MKFPTYCVPLRVLSSSNCFPSPFMSHSFFYNDRLTRKRQERLSGVYKKGLAIGVYGIVPLVGFGLLVYILFFSSFFSIERIDLVTGEGVDQSRVRSQLFEYMDSHKTFLWGHSNLFFFDKKMATNALSLYYVIDSISISKKMPRTLTVHFEGHPFRAYSIREGIVYELQSNGMLGKNIDPFSIEAFPQALRNILLQSPEQNHHLFVKGKKRYPLFLIENIKNSATTPQPSPSQILDTMTLSSLDSFFSDLFELKFFASHAIVQEKEEGVAIILLEGWEVLIDPQGDRALQMKNLSEVLSQKIKHDRKRLKKIDLRFGNKVYYSFK